MFPNPFRAMPAGCPVPPQQPQPTRGPNFTYILPPGWQVAEEGRFALSLQSPDFRAGIIVFGQSGLLQAVTPDQFAYQFMTVNMQLQNVQYAPPRSIQPMPGYTSAALIETTYLIMSQTGPIALKGLVVGNVAVVYDRCDAVMTLIASEASQWSQYESWLPPIGFTACNTGPDPYGRHSMTGAMRGIAVQDHAASTAYQAWSQNLWQQVVAQRQGSIDQQQGAMGPMLTGQEWLKNPFTGEPMRESTTPAVIWVSRDGRQLSSSDPSFDPRTPYDSDWVRVR